MSKKSETESVATLVVSWRRNVKRNVEPEDQPAGAAAAFPGSQPATTRSGRTRRREDRGPATIRMKPEDRRRLLPRLARERREDQPPTEADAGSRRARSISSNALIRGSRAVPSDERSPPTTRTKTSSRVASGAAPVSTRSSGKRPEAARSLPSLMIPMRVQSRSTCSRMCDEKNTVTPRPVACLQRLLDRPRRHRVDPVEGLVEEQELRPWRSAHASATFFRMPIEKSMIIFPRSRSRARAGRTARRPAARSRRARGRRGCPTKCTVSSGVRRS